MGGSFVSKAMTGLAGSGCVERSTLMLVLSAGALFGCATTSSASSEPVAEPHAWQAALAGCSAVRFDQPSWAQRRDLCEPLLRQMDQQGDAPSRIWRQALEQCRDGGHEASCLPLGYLLHAQPERTREQAAFRAAMTQLDERVWRQAKVSHCQRDGGADACAGVGRYLELFGPGAKHWDEAEAARANFPQAR